MRVVKFGGSSLATPRRIAAVADIVLQATKDEASPAQVAVVVSAFGGMTDALLAAAAGAEAREEGALEALDLQEQRHLQAARELALAEDLERLQARLKVAFDEIRELLQGVFLLREASPRTLDSLVSYGERLSAPVVASALRARGLPAQACDARDLIVTDVAFGQASVNPEATRERVRVHFAPAETSGEAPTAAPPLQVVTGFIAASAAGETTTLGRGGSDYTAALLGAALDADSIELWTDVDGVMSADPRLVPTATTLPTISYEELMELSHFGAKVVYPPSIQPARDGRLPLWIKNTFQPQGHGTLVTDSTDRPSSASGTQKTPVRGIASINSLSLLRLEGAGMVGVPGFAMRLFGALARRQVNVILISQASSEHSICFAVSPGAEDAAAEALAEEFALEFQARLVDPVVIERDLAVLAVVGTAMRHNPGVSGRLFQALGDAGINIRAIAQGSSELNISLVVRGADEARALNRIHDAFYPPSSPLVDVATQIARRRRRAEICLAGIGGVGAAFLDLLAGAEAEGAPELRLTGVVRQRAGVFDKEGLDPCSFEGVRRQTSLPGAPPAAAFDLESQVEDWARGAGLSGVFVDCTASLRVAGLYDRVLDAGGVVVTANKVRVAGPWEEARRLFSHAARGRFFYEATVGAGLPVIATLESLLATGDRLDGFSGVLSGTLAFLMDRLGASPEGRSFSEALREASEAGYTEPDPRDDLSGLDAARKLVILARCAGRSWELERVQVRPLLPDPSWFEGDLDAFWARLAELDETYRELLERARAEKRSLAYLAGMTLGAADAEESESAPRVSLEMIDADHPCATNRGTDNLFAFSTRRYARSPLIVRGPGAGPYATAGGVLADVLKAALTIQ